MDFEKCSLGKRCVVKIYDNYIFRKYTLYKEDCIIFYQLKKGLLSFRKQIYLINIKNT